MDSSRRQIKKRAVKIAFVLWVLFIWWQRTAGPAEAEADRYHSPRVRSGATADERVLADAVRHRFGLADKPLPALDLDLAAAARTEARRLLDPGPDGRKDWQNRDLRRLLRDHGLSDYQVGGSFCIGPSKERLIEDLSAWVDSSVKKGWNRLGVGLVSSPSRTAAVLLLTRRSVQLEALPRRLPGPGRVAVSGTTVTGLRNLQLYLTTPHGKVIRERLLRVASGGFSHLVELKRVGTYQVEIMADEGQGPQIAALMTITIGPASLESPDPPAPALSPDASTEVLRRQILDWINRFRKEQGLDPLTVGGRLDKMEEETLSGLLPGASLIHRDGEGRDPADRLKAAGIRPSAYGENLGRNRRLDDLLIRMTKSPSHRANLLGSCFNRAGIGVRRLDQSGEWVVAVLLARFEEEESPRVGRPLPVPLSFWEKVHDRRLRAGLPPIAVSRPLMNRAKSALARHVKNGRLESAELRSALEAASAADPNRTIRQVSVISAGDFDELADFSGFLHHCWTAAGLAAVAAEPKGLVALILLGEGRSARERP